MSDIHEILQHFSFKELSENIQAALARGLSIGGIRVTLKTNESITNNITVQYQDLTDPKNAAKIGFDPGHYLFVSPILSSDIDPQDPNAILHQLSIPLNQALLDAGLPKGKQKGVIAWRFSLYGHSEKMKKLAINAELTSI